MGERKFVRTIWVTWPRWPPRPYMVKTLQKSSSPEPKGQWHCGLVFYSQVKLGLLCFYMGKTVRKSFNGRNLQQMTRVTKGLCLYKKSDSKGLSAPAPGLYTCINTWKIMYKIRLQRHFFETCNKWAKWQCFSVDIRILSTKGCLPLPRGYIHVKKHLKMCIKSEFKEIYLKLATNGQSDKGFLLTSKVCPQGERLQDHWSSGYK